MLVKVSSYKKHSIHLDHLYSCDTEYWNNGWLKLQEWIIL